MIVIKNLSKSFKSTIKEPGLKGSLKSLFYRKYITKIALQDINLTIRPGEILGLIGANGAGKTTLVKVLSGIIHPSSGSVTVYDFIPQERDNSYRRQMSLIMGQKAQVWWDLPALDSFILLKEIYQISDTVYHSQLEYLSNALDVKKILHTPVRKLSLGERMKIELMASLLHEPKVIFLDEPTIGLDISAQKAIRAFIKDYQKKHNPIVILTSHYMEDIKELCSRVVVMKEGQKVFDGPLQDVQQIMSDKKVLSVTTANEVLKFTISKSEISKTTQDLLSRYDVLDLNIHDPPIEDIVEKLMKG